MEWIDLSRIFPLTKFADENTAAQQIKHVLSEAQEAADETITPRERVREALDCLHSLETFFAIIEKERGALWLEEQREWVEDKNRRRGYYRGDQENG